MAVIIDYNDRVAVMKEFVLLRDRVAELEGTLSVATEECARRGDTIARQLQQNEKLAVERYKLTARVAELEGALKDGANDCNSILQDDKAAWLEGE